jgi:hypothetical protein
VPYDPDHPVFTKPDNNNASIWRYMDFTKFVALLDSSALFFSRADLLGDAFEGSYSRANLSIRPILDARLGLSEDSRKGLEAAARREVKSTFINAWHCSEHEPAAMWRLYLKSDEGIAIRSTFGRLGESFRNAEPQVFIGLVRYVDYDLDPMPEGNTLAPFVHKRHSFEHERELRAVVQDAEIHKQVARFQAATDLEKALDPSIEPPPAGITVPVPLDTLIERIYVAPTAPSWFKKLVEKVAKRYAVPADVLQSSLVGKPVY